MVLESVVGEERQETGRDVRLVTRWLEITTVPTGDLARSGAGESESADVRPAESEVVASGNSLTFQASIESEDRAGDVIRAEGWELDNYRLNPVVLWAHRHDLLPVGKSVDVWVADGSLMATVEFAPTEFAQQVKHLFAEGFLRGVSVGFRALKTSQRSGGGGGSHRRGTVFERQELLEISAAPVPMHPFALAAGPVALAAGPFALAAERGGLSSLASQNETEQRELIPLFRELTDIWQSIAAVGSQS